jgi:hypothetical protein
MEQDTIRVRRIELVDETGAPRAWLQADSQGMSGHVGACRVGRWRNRDEGFYRYQRRRCPVPHAGYRVPTQRICRHNFGRGGVCSSDR